MSSASQTGLELPDVDVVLKELDGNVSGSILQDVGEVLALDGMRLGRGVSKVQSKEELVLKRRSVFWAGVPISTSI